ncbi:MAG: Nudix family hydrolase [Pseudohongiella sp.]|nr:Nudix family hydrolase [Pseudohongiella sp.]
MKTTDQPARKRVHVAVGVIYGTDGKILIAQRSADQHLGGLWEFPGGKVETGETVNDALVRELHEELGITALSQSALCCIQHDYQDKSVLLDVWNVDTFAGTAQGKEGQPLRWLFPHELRHQDFPEANRAIIRAIMLPDFFAILNIDSSIDSSIDSTSDYLQGLPDACLLRLRNAAPATANLSRHHHYISSLKDWFSANTSLQTRLILDISSSDELDPLLLERLSGVHANRHVLKKLQSRPVADHLLFGASCHNAEELALAQALGADYALLSPVSETSSHVGQAGMGWDTFRQLSQSTSLPVYAMGGLNKADLPTARQYGARGIAGISLFKN